MARRRVFPLALVTGLAAVCLHRSLVSVNHAETMEIKPVVEESRSAAPIVATEESSTSVTARSNPPDNHTRVYPNGLKVPFPIFVVSLYKSGTTSVHRYFKCGKQRAMHKNLNHRFVGKCIREGIRSNTPDFMNATCGGGYDIFTDLSAMNPRERDCYDPSVFDLEGIYQAYPNMTLMLGTRDSFRWLDSVERYEFPPWSLIRDLTTRCPNLWPAQKDTVGNKTILVPEDIRQFYLWHMDHVRKFAASHPSVTFFDFDVEAADAGVVLEEKIGIPSTCWQQANMNKVKSNRTDG